MDHIEIPVVPTLGMSADIDVERQLVKKLERALVGAPLAVALNAISRTSHALQGLWNELRAKAVATQGSPVKDNQGQLKIAD